MVGIYCRVSTEKQKDKYSIPVQKERGIQFAQSLNEPYELFVEAQSGKSLILREAFALLLNNLETKRITKIWAIEYERLFRNVEEQLSLRSFFIKHNVSIYINDHLEDISDSRFLEYGVRAVVSENERLRIIATTKRGRDRHIDEGGRWF